VSRQGGISSHSSDGCGADQDSSSAGQDAMMEAWLAVLSDFRRVKDEELSDHHKSRPAAAAAAPATTSAHQLVPRGVHRFLHRDSGDTVRSTASDPTGASSADWL